MLHIARHITVSIARSPEDVYSFAANPENLPTWAAGLSGAKIHREGDHWFTESDGLGKVKIKFATKNSFGIMDHDVTVPTGETTHNPFRVLPNGSGSEVVFTVFKTPQMSDGQFVNDARQIQTDLEKLKSVLEHR